MIGESIQPVAVLQVVQLVIPGPLQVAQASWHGSQVFATERVNPTGQVEHWVLRAPTQDSQDAWQHLPPVPTSKGV